MAEFLMPKLSDTMEEGTILQWLVEEGASVAPGEQLVEIETDKANMVVEASDAGVLHRLAAEGDVLPVGAPIATIGAAGADAPAPAPEPSRPEAEEAPVAGPSEEGDDGGTNIPVADDGTPATIGAEVYPGARDAEEEDAPRPAPAPPPPGPAPAAPVAAAPAMPAPAGPRPKASPLARRLAAERGVDLRRVRGTGPDGRIVRADVEAAARGDAAATVAPAAAPVAGGTAAVPAAAPAPAPPPPAPVAGARVPLTRLQAAVARRMSESKAAAPHFYLEREVDVADALALRRELREAADGDGPSLNDLVLRAVAMAAAERPEALRRFGGDALVEAPGVHLGVAVAVEGGLLVPVVRDAAAKRVGQIAEEVRALAERCRAGTITPAELEGSAITVSNLGMYGVDRFSAVINPPESAILAVGRAAPRAVVRDGAVAARETMWLTLSVDHRALHGAEAAQLLGRIAALMERPHALVL